MRKERALSTLSQLIALWLLAHVAPTDAVCGASVGTEVFDERASVVALSDTSGNLLYTANYGPHGEDWGATGENPTPFAWLGGYGVMDAGRAALRRDRSQGRSRSSRPPLSPLYLTRHRLYSATLNRFLSADPLGPAGGFNLYAYGNSDPLAYIDPLGLCPGGIGYDRFGDWSTSKVLGLKSRLESQNWILAGTLATGLDLLNGFVHFPASIGHLEEGAGTFAGNPSWETAPGLCYDIATVATIGACTCRGLPSLRRASMAAYVKQPVNAVEQPVNAVIGRVRDLEKIGPNEKTLLPLLPDQGSPKANWIQNSRVLRTEMQRKVPIRDASPSDHSGAFLNAERNLLRNHGWKFDPETSYWYPPE